jgi:predicted kinase
MVTLVAYELAVANLWLGNNVIAEAVNPLSVIRDTWRTLAKHAVCDIFVIEIFCSDRIEHRRTGASREAEITGHALPTWDEVQNLKYESWDSDRLFIDSAQVTLVDAVQMVVDSIKFQSMGR